MAYNNDEILGLEEVEIDNTPIDELDSETVNLILVGIDQSGSMHNFRSDMEASLNSFKDGIINSKEADTILVSRLNFMDDNTDITGYKKITEFDTDYEADGQTPLYAAIVEGVDKLTNDQGTGYMDFLKQQGMRVKSVFAVFSDGDDTSSDDLGITFQNAKSKIEYLNRREIVTASVCFGADAYNEAKRLGFKNILKVDQCTASELRKAFDCLSKSVADNSKSVVNKTDTFFDV